MSQFISLRVLASLGLGQSKKTSKGHTAPPPVSEPGGDAPASARDEPSSASRISVNRVRTTGERASRLQGSHDVRDTPRMLSLDLKGRRALVAGVADDGGFGFAIAKALAEAGASVCVGTWPPAMGIFETLLRRGKMDEGRKLSSGALLEFEKIYPLDAAYDTMVDVPEEVRTNKRYAERGDFTIDGMAKRSTRISATSRSTSSFTRWPTGRR